MITKVYCIWNDNELIHRTGHKAAKVILVETTWDKIQHIPRTGVRNWKVSQKMSAIAFADAKRTEIQRNDWDNNK